MLRNSKKKSTATTSVKKDDKPLKVEVAYQSYKSWSDRHYLTAFVLFVVILVCYLNNGEMTIGGDSTANTLLTLKLVRPGALRSQSLAEVLSFSPLENPCLFQWRYTPDLNSVPQRGLNLQHWNLTAPVILASGEKVMKSAWDLYELKRLVLEGPNYYLVDTKSHPNNRWANTFGIGTALVSAPLFFLYTTFITPIRHKDVCQYPRADLLTISKFTASFFTTLSCVVMYFIAVRILRSLNDGSGDQRVIQKRNYYLAIISTLFYGLGTSLFSINAQALWQHAPNTLFITIGIHQFFKLHQDYMGKSSAVDEFGLAITSVLCCVSLCLAVFCRPTSAIYALVVILHLITEVLQFTISKSSDNRQSNALKSLLIQGVVGLVFGGLFLYHNKFFFHDPLTTGQTLAADIISKGKSTVPGTWTAPFLDGAYMLLVSPSRGLLVHSPYLVFSIFAILYLMMKFSSQQFYAAQSLRAFMFGMIGLFYAASIFFDYWGGWCWSSRPLTDITPILGSLIVLLLPTIYRHKPLFYIFITLGLLSIAIHTVGVYLYDPMIWNYQMSVKNSKTGEFEAITDFEVLSGNKHISGTVPLNIDQPEYRYRLYSWKDSQISYLLNNLSLARKIKQHTVKSWIEGRLS
ncbi:hypothetical protein DLAC_01275 [Tieghemostelium lacteum]|uniref:Transmembrane protein n=1 Tax=Tieghemostelium lacteum TaxID=361077 RepID=A0A152A8L2_TIELA|nr:hypothetical protein DLAC_01275 [Tieghemostelium lacteum]|eukprot:KYR02435.1 hypothetical protein DLAC_01275 [Tieghemostelium lacteum]